MRRYIPQLDGLRAFAILAVLVFHARTAELPLFPAAWSFINGVGWSGVDLFFVLSGFLITGILIDTKEQKNYFRNFFVRRGLRIWPLYYVFLIAIYLIVPLVARGRSQGLSMYPWWYYALYIQNSAFGSEQPSQLLPTWSLAVEEQFYLLWPFFVYFIRPKRLLKVLFVTVVAGTILKIALFSPINNPNVTLFHFDELGLGALVAAYTRSDAFSPIRLRKYGTYATGLLVFVFCWLSMFGYTDVVGRTGLGLATTLLGIGFSGLLVVCLNAQPGSWTYGLLTNWALIRIGKISYGIYLWHALLYGVYRATPIYRALMRSHSIALQLLNALLLLGIPILFAECSWRFFEEPVLRLKAKFETPGASAGVPASSPQPAVPPHGGEAYSKPAHMIQTLLQVPDSPPAADGS